MASSMPPKREAGCSEGASQVPSLAAASAFKMTSRKPPSKEPAAGDLVCVASCYDFWGHRYRPHRYKRCRQTCSLPSKGRNVTLPEKTAREFCDRFLHFRLNPLAE
jgi:hypothetical protein